MERDEIEFQSGGDRCAGWLYSPRAGEGSTCIVMANGFSLTRHDGLPLYAERLADAGAHVVLFDYRYFGDSGGVPRQRFRRRDQLADWRAAIAFAGLLPAVRNLVGWGYSFGGGHVATLASQGAPLAAAVLMAPYVDGLRRAVATPPGLAMWLAPRAVADMAGRHNLVPVTAEPGRRAAMALPGEAAGFARAVPSGSPWRNEISPGFALTAVMNRPVTRASRIRCPVWVGLGERDITTAAVSIERLAGRVPHTTLERYDFDHFDPLAPEHADRVAGHQVAFLEGVGLL
jgi:pimeloyl-ACP methyl ester carboxylesterase